MKNNLGRFAFGGLLIGWFVAFAVGLQGDVAWLIGGVGGGITGILLGIVLERLLR
jgi:hypothetical protein